MGSTMYQNNNYAVNAFWVIYLIFGIGCIIFFFAGVCALLCCCRQRFRGIQRKGYIIRDPEQNAPLMMPSVATGDPSMYPAQGAYPTQSPPYPMPQPTGYPPTYPPQAAPPAYESPAKY